MAELDGLLLLEIGGAEQRHGRPVAEAGEAEQLAAEQAAPAPELPRAGVLDVEVDEGGNALDSDVADHFARRTARGAKRQPHVVAGKVARKQQIALGLVAVEHRLLGQLVQIAGDGRFRSGRVASHPDLGHFRHQHPEAHGPVGDALLGNLDRGDVTRIAEDRRRMVADLAHRRDRVLSIDHRCISRAQDRLR